MNEGASTSSGSTETGPIKATLPMWKCSKIMQLQREIHPTVLSSLEGIVDQVNKHTPTPRQTYALFKGLKESVGIYLLYCRGLHINLVPEQSSVV